jgi:phosphopantothenoylcysteine decarboxylase/phosphopantothenate--cysteine ligase
MKKKLKILITAGPTREKIDAVRFISNKSSGKMGYALANTAYAQNLDVTLISGPVNIPKINNIKTIYVESAADMAEQVFKYAAETDIIIMCAAVADYTPIVKTSKKIKKNNEHLIIELERTEDILAKLGQIKTKQYLVGFAAETENLLQYAKEKLIKKKIDLIIANDISSESQGFSSDYNAVTIIDNKYDIIQIPKQKKQQIADEIIQIIIKKMKLG